MTSDEPSTGGIVDPEIADVLHKNPEVAHFIADLAAGSTLDDAVQSHFGNTAPAHPDTPDTPQKPAAQPVPQPSDEVAYTPLTGRPDTEPSAPVFLAAARRSFWPDNFSF